jgi:hypothetical protein
MRGYLLQAHFKTQRVVARIFYSEPIRGDIYYNIAREALCKPQTVGSLLHGHCHQMRAFILELHAKMLLIGSPIDSHNAPTAKINANAAQIDAVFASDPTLQLTNEKHF